MTTVQAHLLICNRHVYITSVLGYDIQTVVFQHSYVFIGALVSYIILLHYDMHYVYYK